MQKRTRLRPFEVIFIFICVCCSIFSIWQFYQSLNRTLVKDEEPIATISFKYKTAQRKFIDDLLWDRLQQDSPVYEGDTIRTAEQSEATISFVDGNIMELQSNTMIRVNLSEEGGAEVDFTSGSISVRTGESSSMKIRSGSSVVEVAANASVAAAGGSEESGPLKIAVKDGAASFTGDNGTIDLEAGKVTEISSTGTIEEHFLSVNYPEDNYRTMTFTPDGGKIAFSWESAGRTVILETSENKNFDSITTSATYNNTSTAQLSFSEGAHWWRMTTVPLSENEEPEVATGKVTVLYSPTPTLIAPRAGNETLFRTKLPQVRLSWSESERATAYRIDIADNPNMRNPVFSQRFTTTSTVINTLGEGTWYWTVTPYYTFDDIGYANSSVKSYFYITRSAELNAPVLLGPEDDGIVCTRITQADGSVTNKSITFSWKNDAEALSYDLAIFKENASSPFITKTVSGNYCSINTAVDAIPNGNYTWQVTINDEEGNSKASAKNSFYAIDADIEQKTLSPADNYRIATARTSEMSFTWKTNVPNPTTLEVASDSAFRNIVLKTETTDTTVPGKMLAAGTYYWRISAKAGSAVISTQPKTFIVEPVMPAPVISYPEKNGELVKSLEADNELRWNLVEEADYYQVRIYKNDKPSEYVIDQNFIISKDGSIGSLPIDIMNLEAGDYGWSVQAFRNESAVASRSSGTVTRSTFTVRQLHPVTIQSPGDGAVYDGVRAWTSPSLLTWTSKDTAKTCTVKLYRLSQDTKTEIKSWTNARSGIQLPQLEAGSYWWEIEATTVTKSGEYSISPESGRGFTVTSLPKLASTTLAQPDDTEVFGASYLSANSNISFAWEPVPDATEYVFTLSDASGKTLKKETLEAGSAEYVLEDLSVLENGTFTWSVQAVRRLKGTKLTDKEKVLSGTAVSATFSIELPALSIPQIKDFGKRYGL
ncbi:MAG: FecR domain-containing protein [Treponema sp.]|nr:FecR domain-containing protein [Candidatus Treponema caballi]